jgi:hypothetical protein
MSHDNNTHGRCVGPYETRCAVCTAVLEALPVYDHEGPRCSLCREFNDSEDSTTGWCVACRLASGEFDSDDYFLG